MNTGIVVAIFRLLLQCETIEQDIIDYLKSWRGSFVSGKEIARKVGGKQRFEENHGWALPILTQMVRIGLMEKDHSAPIASNPSRKKTASRNTSPLKS